MKTISVARAVGIGQLWVNAPVFLLLGGPILLSSRLYPDSDLLNFSVLILGFAAAWGYWAVSVPRWRIWAMERVLDHSALQRSAVASGLVWPEGHALGRTEVTNAKLRAKREALRQHRT